MRKLLVSLGLLSLTALLAGCNLVQQPQTEKIMPPATPADSASVAAPVKAEVDDILKLQPGGQLKAVIVTSMGNIIVRLFPEKSPITVANFVALAEGTRPWQDPKTGQVVTDRPLYQNILVHRLIPEFMMQTGDPLGTGTGGPGYQFADETDNGLKFDKPGLLAMANAGPNTNGSQFFITFVPTPWLDGNHTIFGEVIEGQEVLDKIEAIPTGPDDRPKQDIVVKEIKIVRLAK